MKMFKHSLLAPGVMLAAFGFLLCGESIGQAQQFSLQNSTINGGNQVAHGGRFSVAASGGQTASGQSSGSQFSMRGGQASAATSLTPPIVPTMAVMHSTPANVVIAWQPLISGYVLEFTDTLKSPVWSIFFNGQTNLLSVPSRSRHLYFRLRNAATPTE